MVQDTFECVVGVFERTERLVELVADVVVGLIAQVVPPGQGWHPKRLAVEVGVFGELVGLILGTAALEFGCDEPFPLGLELVRGALKEQQPEDVLLELRRIHLAPQDVCGRQQMPLQLPKVNTSPHSRRWLAPRLGQLRAAAFCVSLLALLRSSPTTRKIWVRSHISKGAS